MATDTFLDGTDVLLLIDLVTPITADIDTVDIPGNFEVMACLTSNSWDVATASTDTSSKCSGKDATSLPGQRSGTASAEGRAITDADALATSRINHNKLADLENTGTTFWLALFDSALNTVRYSLAYITSFSDAAPNAEGQTFSASFTLVGPRRTAAPTT